MPGHLAKDGGNSTHQVTASPTPETVSKGENVDTDCPCTVYMKIVQSSGNVSNTPPHSSLHNTIQDTEGSIEVDTGCSVTVLNSNDARRTRKDTSNLLQ